MKEAERGGGAKERRKKGKKESKQTKTQDSWDFLAASLA